jgi:hypothetical protein
MDPLILGMSAKDIQLKYSEVQPSDIRNCYITSYEDFWQELSGLCVYQNRELCEFSTMEDNICVLLSISPADVLIELNPPFWWWVIDENGGRNRDAYIERPFWFEKFINNSIESKIILGWFKILK